MALIKVLTPKGKYKPRIIESIKRINRLTGTPETAYKFDSSKFKGIDIYKYSQVPYVYKPANGVKYFVKNHLPTLRFHNPEILFSVKELSVSSENELSRLPLKVKVHGVDPANDFTINCHDKNLNQIFEELLKTTDAKPLAAEEIFKLPLKPKN
ncbi:hypothetical protein SBY92_002818 [Candida maltosa Xu316]|uniref:Large-subunit ribosomal protein, mitochondrial, putative n=1 Tax=Candida maltosa (strain Xu316) TaxID=1245528 RepID=M3J5L6_CANMX|nr:Large-subunit ribosomal protein, mitochondrial, putative [Candida maltosa Xu316]